MMITVPVIPFVSVIISLVAFLVSMTDEDKFLSVVTGAILAGLSFLTSYGFCSLTGLL